MSDRINVNVSVGNNTFCCAISGRLKLAYKAYLASKIHKIENITIMSCFMLFFLIANTSAFLRVLLLTVFCACLLFSRWHCIKSWRWLLSVKSIFMSFTESEYGPSTMADCCDMQFYKQYRGCNLLCLFFSPIVGSKATLCKSKEVFL